MKYLEFISDEDLKDCVRRLLSGVQPENVDALHKNVVDPFSALFDCSLRGISLEDWVNFELTRQYQKALQNRIGDFHNDVLGCCSGMKKPEEGVFDLVNHEKRFVAEVKNKDNTINAGAMVTTYKNLSHVTQKTNTYYGYTAYLVTVIIAKLVQREVNKEFSPSDPNTGEQLPEHPKIRQIDGKSFYHMVTGDPNALQKLYEMLPSVIREVRPDLRIVWGSSPLEDAFFQYAFVKKYRKAKN